MHAVYFENAPKNPFSNRFHCMEYFIAIQLKLWCSRELTFVIYCWCPLFEGDKWNITRMLLYDNVNRLASVKILLNIWALKITLLLSNQICICIDLFLIELLYFNKLWGSEYMNSKMSMWCDSSLRNATCYCIKYYWINLQSCCWSFFFILPSNK